MPFDDRRRLFLARSAALGTFGLNDVARGVYQLQFDLLSKS